MKYTLCSLLCLFAILLSACELPQAPVTVTPSALPSAVPTQPPAPTATLPPPTATAEPIFTPTAEPPACLQACGPLTVTLLSSVQPLAQLAGFEAPLDTFAFLEDGSMVVVAGNAAWQQPSDACYGALSAPQKGAALPMPLSSGTILPAAGLLAGVYQSEAGYGGALVNLADGSLVGQFDLGTEAPLAPVVPSPDGAWLAAAQGSSVSLYAPDGSNQAKVSSHMQPVSRLAFSPDGARLASVDTSGFINIWDVPTLSMDTGMVAAEGVVTALVFSPDGRFLALGYENGTLIVWQVGQTRPLFTLAAHAGPVIGLAFLAGSDGLVSAAADQVLKAWDVATGQELLSLPLPGMPRYLALSPDGLLVGLGYEDGSLQLFGMPCSE